MMPVEGLASAWLLGRPVRFSGSAKTLEDARRTA
jgi:hypothetical protein